MKKTDKDKYDEQFLSSVKPEDIDPRIIEVARGLISFAESVGRDLLIFLFVFQTKNISLIHPYLIDRYSKSVMAYWKPNLGLTAQYHRGQRLVDR